MRTQFETGERGDDRGGKTMIKIINKIKPRRRGEGPRPISRETPVTQLQPRCRQLRCRWLTAASLGVELLRLGHFFSLCFPLVSSLSSGSFFPSIV